MDGPLISLTDSTIQSINKLDKVSVSKFNVIYDIYKKIYCSKNVPNELKRKFNDCLLNFVQNDNITDIEDNSSKEIFEDEVYSLILQNVSGLNDVSINRFNSIYNVYQRLIASSIISDNLKKGLSNCLLDLAQNSLVTDIEDKKTYELFADEVDTLRDNVIEFKNR